MTGLRSPYSLIAATALAVAACAPKDAKDTAAAGAAAATAAPNVVQVRASDFSFEAPAQIPSGYTTFKLTNAGPNLHHMIIARIDSGKTYADALAALTKPGAPPMWLVPVGGPNAPDPQTESNATVNMQPGEYAIFCVVDIPAGVPHVMKGMIKQLTVTPAAGATAAAPTADIKVTLADYSFTLSTPITAGTRTFEVVGAPGQPHEIEIIRLAPGKTFADFSKWMEGVMAGKPSGPPPANALGGTTPAPAGTSVYFSADFTPGNYALLCFMPDAKDGKPHLMHGMIQEFAIQ